ncbi:MAG: L,D-transpeptidase family protein, partial [Methylocystis sp.]
MTAGEKAKRLLRAALAAAAVSIFVAPAVAAQYPPRRAELFDPPPLVALFDVKRVPTRAPLDNPDFAVADAAPAAVLLDVELRAEPVKPDALDLAWSLQPEEKRDLALALEAWTTSGGAALGPERHRLRAALATAYATRDL